jgi:hypothetical protein
MKLCLFFKNSHFSLIAFFSLAHLALFSLVVFSCIFLIIFFLFSWFFNFLIGFLLALFHLFFPYCFLFFFMCVGTCYKGLAILVSSKITMQCEGGFGTTKLDTKMQQSLGAFQVSFFCFFFFL